jgi:hypothetical protein
LQVTFRDIINLGFTGDFVTGNAYAGDYHLKGNFTLNTRWGNLTYMLTNALQEPDRFYMKYYSNHYRWDNPFRKETYVLNTIEYRFRKLHTGINFYHVGSFVYFNSSGFPAQLDDDLRVVAIFLRKLFNVGNLSFDIRGIYQSASNSALRIPEFAGDISFYYTKDLFKKAAILQPGIDIFYNTPYFGYAYMPSIRSFYLQHEKKVGDYFYGDVSLNLQVKRGRLFLKYINLCFLLKDFRYYTVPSYPMPDGGFRFGVSWMFYD